MRTAIKASLAAIAVALLVGCGGGGGGSSNAAQPVAPTTMITNKYANEITESYRREINLKTFWTAFLHLPGYRSWNLSGDVLSDGKTFFFNAFIDKRTTEQDNAIFNSVALREASSSRPAITIMFWVDKLTLRPKTLLYELDQQTTCVGVRQTGELPDAAKVGDTGMFISGDLQSLVGDTCATVSVGQFSSMWSIRAFDDQVCNTTGCAPRKAYFCIEADITRSNQSESTAVCFEIDVNNGVGDGSRWYERSPGGTIDLRGPRL